MADLDGDFRFLVESIQRFLGLLSAQALRRPGRDQRGSALAAHIDKTVQGVKDRVTDAEVEYSKATDDIDRAEGIKQVRLLAGYAYFMQRALPWLENALESSLELGALYFIDEMAKAVIGEHTDSVPTRGDEFSTEKWPFEPLFPALKLTVGSGPLPIVLNFPALEAKSFLLLPLYGHELGHTAVWKHDLVSTCLAPVRADGDFPVKFNVARDALATAQGFSKHRAQLIIDERLEHWTEELLCDQVGLQYLGPAFLLAFATYLVALSWNDPGPRHPPTTMRVAHLLNWIDDQGWTTLLEDRLPGTLIWLREVAAAPRPSTASPVSFLLDTMEDVRSHATSSVRAALGSAVYLPQDYDPVAAHIDGLLAHEILPVQRSDDGRPFDARTIMFAGWLSIFDEIGEDSGVGLCRALAREESHEFFTKALEMRSVLERWQKL